MSDKALRVSPAQLAQERAHCGEIRARWEREGRTPRAFVDTYGCQQNEADSERIRGLLELCGYELQADAEGADLVVFNTCAVREHAEQRVFGNLGALVHTRRRHPAQRILLCGCMAGQPEVVERIRASYRHVDGVFSADRIWQLPSLLLRVLRGERVFAPGDAAGSIAEGLPASRAPGPRAWISAMYGCNNFCSYCIVPYVRGRERSRRPEDILSEAQALLDAGYRDLTLLGQNVNSYGRGLEGGMDFADLLTALSRLPGDFWLRFMTSHPKDASKKLFDAMAASPKIAKQIHLPFQAGSDRVLHAMNRRYTAAQYLSLVDYARSVMPGLVLTSDVIVGFPGETEAEFEETLALVERVRCDALFTFLYSPRPGTPAARLPDPVPRAEKNRWFDRLCQTQNRISEEKHRAYVGRTLRVLADGVEDGALTARTEGNRLVRLPGASPALVGQFLDAKITAASTWSLVGEPAEATGKEAGA